MRPFHLPEHLSDEQARAVVDLLQELLDQLWERYAERLLAVYANEEQQRLRCADPPWERDDAYL